MPRKSKKPGDDWVVAVVIQPGHPGIRKLEKEWGSKLVCVRYRYNARTGKRRTTVEIVVEEAPWKRRRADEVGVEIRSWEGELRKAVLEAGGRWDATSRLWLVAKSKVARLGLSERVRTLRTRSPKMWPRPT